MLGPSPFRMSHCRGRQWPFLNWDILQPLCALSGPVHGDCRIAASKDTRPKRGARASHRRRAFRDRILSDKSQRHRLLALEGSATENIVAQVQVSPNGVSLVIRNSGVAYEG